MKRIAAGLVAGIILGGTSIGVAATTSGGVWMKNGVVCTAYKKGVVCGLAKIHNNVVVIIDRKKITVGTATSTRYIGSSQH